MKIGLLVGLGVVGALGIFAYTQLTIFVIQPIGALPSGGSLLMWRVGTFGFIDSADGVCVRKTGSVSLLCRGMVLAQVAGVKREIVRLPYSDILYNISTGGERYDR